MPFTSLNRRLLASTIASLGVYAGFGASYITAATAVALGLAAIFTHRGPRDPTLTVQDRCLMNQERLCFGAVPGCGTMAVAMHVEALPSIATASSVMRKVIAKFPRFGCVVQEELALEDVTWKRVDVDLTKHLVEHALVSADNLSAKLDELINTDLPRDQPLWRFDLLTVGKGGGGCVLLRASHALGDGLRLIGAAGDFLSFGDGSPATLDVLERMSRNKLSIPPRGPVGLLSDFVAAATMDKVRDEDRTPFHAPGAIFKREEPRANVSASVPLEHVKAIRAASPPGTTLNDVILACLCGALQKYAASIGEPLEGDPLVRALCAVSMPRQASRGKDEMYNDFLLPSIKLPLSAATYSGRLEQVKKVMEETKASRSGYIMGKLLTVLSRLGLDALVGNTQLTVFGKHAFVYSNLPGFTQPVHLFGESKAKLTAFEAYYPNLVSQLLFLSYNGQLTCSLSTVKSTIKEPKKLVDAFAKEVEDVWAVSLVGGSESKRAFAEMLLKATQG